MTESGARREVERAIADALAAKADQIDVDPPPSPSASSDADEPSATVIHLTPARPSVRRFLATLSRRRARRRRATHL